MISSRDDLPNSYSLLTGPGGILELSDAQSAEMCVMKLDNDTCWALAVPSAFKSVRFFQLLKDIQKRDLNLAFKDEIDPGLIKLVMSGVTGNGSNAKDENSEIIGYFDKIIGDAMRLGASDVHIEKRRQLATIKMRRNGRLLNYSDMAPEIAGNLCSVVYNVLGENRDVMYSENEFQQCAINRVIGGDEVKLRYQSLPTYPEGGFDVVLRVLPIGRDDKMVPLLNLGYTKWHCNALDMATSKPVGALVIAGTTGSGKSTTLKNLLMQINEVRNFQAKIYTVEDPPEYRIPNVSQIPVIRRKGDDYTKKSPFEAPITACMRADPDVLMIGEVRDRVTGDLLKKAVQSGHQCLTTVHAASGLAICERFADFEVQRSVLGSTEFFACMAYQRLVPILCPRCCLDFEDLVASSAATEYQVAAYQRVMQVCDPAMDILKTRGPGCEHCGKQGVVGRTVCAEIVVPDLELLEYFRNDDALGAFKYWRSTSDKDLRSENMQGKTSLEHALQKMLKGIVDPFDIEDSYGLLTPELLAM